MSSFKRIIVVLSLLFILLFSIFLFWVSENWVQPIIMYHNVAVLDDPKLNDVTPETFRNEMFFLVKEHYTVHTLDDFLEARNKQEQLPNRSVIITFDDGFEGVYQYAFPILKEFNLPAIVFIPSDFINKEGYLTLNQIKEMQDSGLISFGSHTVSHSYLPELSADRQEWEIKESKHRLEAILGKEVNYLAYPSGGFTENIKDILKANGYKVAVTTNRGYDRTGQDLFELKRVSMRNNDAQWYKLWAKYSGYYNIFRQSRSPHSPKHSKDD